MNTIEVLTRTRELISNPRRWCKGHSVLYGYTADGGRMIKVAYCLIGAIATVCGNRHGPEYEGVLDALLAQANVKAPCNTDNSKALAVAFRNDGVNFTHAQAIDWIDKTIAMLERDARLREQLAAIVAAAQAEDVAADRELEDA